MTRYGRQVVRARLAELLHEPLERLANETHLRKLSRYDLRSARRLLNEFGLDLPEDQLHTIETVQQLLEAVESAPRLARVGSRVAGQKPGDTGPMPALRTNALDTLVRAPAAAGAMPAPPGAAALPPAPAGTFEPAIPYEAERIRAVAVHCGDGRLGLQVDELLHTALKLPRYDRLACPGGPVALAGRLMAFWEARGVLDQLRFLIESHAVRQVVLIAHERCAYYADRLRLSEDAVAAEQRDDLSRARDAVCRIDSQLEVAGYVACLEGSRVWFERVFAGEALDSRLRLAGAGSSAHEPNAAGRVVSSTGPIPVRRAPSLTARPAEQVRPAAKGR
jgi:hypothetical protein